ncbi:hypothetical protein H9Q69_001229 [Fusarium xylarioides]|uniref:Uncharacterized protein n=1 Tax=Fusarium xylarioides TaxID=221167 RepID=A0A9P7HPZ0_9HYPO|nr:hypothetical protein H9Q72_008380 [Fusarium xylarioides]KAG5799718.1 hypothetical protein H9Q69_001229 [Fusarium xylarioides]KAG5810260.1 hypothetical protein H9Q74_014049 [Fusarium xylarioides]
MLEKVLQSGNLDLNDPSGQEALVAELMDMGDFVESTRGQIPNNDPGSDDGLCPNSSKKRGLPCALARRSHRNTFGSRSLNGHFALKLDNYQAGWLRLRLQRGTWVISRRVW